MGAAALTISVEISAANPDSGSCPITRAVPIGEPTILKFPFPSAKSPKRESPSEPTAKIVGDEGAVPSGKARRPRRIERGSVQSTVTVSPEIAKEDLCSVLQSSGQEK